LGLSFAALSPFRDSSSCSGGEAGNGKAPPVCFAAGSDPAAILKKNTPIALDFVVVFTTITFVPKKSIQAEYPISFRATEQEMKMLAWLREQLGLSTSGILKMAVRRLYAKEGGKPEKL